MPTGFAHLTHRFNLLWGSVGDVHGLLLLCRSVCQKLLNLHIRDASDVVLGLPEQVLEAGVEVLHFFNREWGREGGEKEVEGEEEDMGEMVGDERVCKRRRDSKTRISTGEQKYIYKTQSM